MTGPLSALPTCSALATPGKSPSVKSLPARRSLAALLSFSSTPPPLLLKLVFLVTVTLSSSFLSFFDFSVF